MFLEKLLTKKDEEKYKHNIDMSSIPSHIAIIMDGNGRWAKRRGLPRVMGHRAGVETIRQIVKSSSKIGVKYLTLYAFSTENWKRPSDEVNALMNLLVEYLRNEVDELNKNNVVVSTIGDIGGLPSICQQELRRAWDTTKNNNGLRLILALNYGSRNELKNATVKIAKKVKDGILNIDDINEKTISDHLDTSGIPDPDILIRPSGEMRISNFLLYQIAYTELWFCSKSWPDFRDVDLYKAIYDYQKRDRRYGAVK